MGTDYFGPDQSLLDVSVTGRGPKSWAGNLLLPTDTVWECTAAHQCWKQCLSCAIPNSL